MGDEVERLGLEESPAVESTMKEELSMEIDPPFKQNAATAEDWRKALDKVVPAVVVLRTTACRAFDTEAAGASYATGFVVDKRRGIILTNRHVVKPGPVVAEAMFLNREEIPVYPVYRDPAVRALRFLQNGRDLSPEQWPAITIPRGTLQATFVHKGCDEKYRLGLQRDTELIVRNASPPEETGMLIVDLVVPGGPAHKHLETGDVLVRVNGEVLTQFLKLETLLDDSVNQNIEFQIEKRWHSNYS